MAVELATAYVNLVSSAKGMGKDIERGGEKVQGAAERSK